MFVYTRRTKDVQCYYERAPNRGALKIPDICVAASCASPRMLDSVLNGLIEPLNDDPGPSTSARPRKCCAYLKPMGICVHDAITKTTTSPKKRLRQKRCPLSKGPLAPTLTYDDGP